MAVRGPGHQEATMTLWSVPSGLQRKVPAPSVSSTRGQTQREEAECGCGVLLSWSYPRASKWKYPERGESRCLAFCKLQMGMRTPAARMRVEIPEGTAPIEQVSRDRCAGNAGRILGRWPRTGPSEQHPAPQHPEILSKLMNPVPGLNM